MGTRWGIAGPGGIAARFAEGMRMVDGGTLAGVASRSLDRAEAFARRFAVERAYGSYEALAADDTLDVVYIATPASRHATDALLYLAAGKHVLCEKPFAVNARQAKTMVDAARQRGLFLMEAMWSRFLPAYGLISDLLADGRIGDPLLVDADFGWRVPTVDPTDRHFDLEQGGGVLLDLGVYPVQLCSMVLGTPDAVMATGHVGSTGVDEVVAALLQYPHGRLGVVKSAFRTPLTCTARIAGTAGSIDIPAFMNCPMYLDVNGIEGQQRVDAAFEGDGIRFQVDEVHRCLKDGLLESPRMPLDETVSIMDVLDTIRAQVGVRYPGEQD
jgi:predicted dehydrogenase